MKKTVILLPIMLLLLAGAMGTSGYKIGLLYHPTTATTYPPQVHPGDQNVSVEIQLNNNFIYPYENITTELTVDSPFGGIKTTNFIGEILPGRQKSIFYKINVGPNVDPGEYRLNHRMVYSYSEIDDDGNETTHQIEVSKKVTIVISYSEKLEITAVGFTPVEILPGEETKLVIAVKNTGSVPVRDAEVSYTGFTTTETTVGTGGALTTSKTHFLPIGVTKKTVENIQPGATEEVRFTLRSMRTTEIAAYEISVSATYDETTKTDLAVLNVIGKPDVRLAGIQMDEDAIFQGQKFSVSIQLENIGTGDAKSVKVEIISDNVSGIKTAYVGTVDVDDTGTAIFDLQDYNPGHHKITMRITYDDVYGNEQPSLEFDAEYGIEERPADYSGIIILVVVVVIIIYLIYRRWRKKKELEQLVS